MTSLWNEIASTPWVANTGIPLLLTIAALLFGFWSVRRQLEHDRELMTAQNRSGAARALGTVIFRATTPFNFRADSQEVWRNSDWDSVGGNRIDDARWQAEAAGLAGAPIDALAQANYGMSLTWSSVWSSRQSTLSTWLLGDDHNWGSLGVEPEPLANLLATEMITPYISRLIQVAEVLLRWDGLGQLPEVDPWTPPNLANGLDADWTSLVAHHMEALENQTELGADIAALLPNPFVAGTQPDDRS
jgi:hypothetical protein